MVSRTAVLGWEDVGRCGTTGVVVANGGSSVVMAAPVVVVGELDGVHVGHRKVLDAARRLAARHRVAVAGVVLDADLRDRVLMSPSLRARRVLAAGAVSCRVLDVADPSADGESLAAMIEHALHPGMIVMSCATVGAEGVYPYLAGEFRRRGVEVVEVDKEVRLGEVVSSRRIRELLEVGEVESASMMLGRPYALRGVVLRGQQLGRTMGFPTANMEPPARQVLPATGVYAAVVRLAGDRRVDAAVNIGVRPTVDLSGRVVIEAHLLDVDEDLYDQTITVELVDRIRAERRFDGLDALCEQLERDVAVTRVLRPADRRWQ